MVSMSEQRKKIGIALFIALSMFVLVYSIVDALTVSLDREVIVGITPGMTLDEAAVVLESSGVLESDMLFKLFVQLESKERGIQEGYYRFEGTVSAKEVAHRLMTGDYQIESTRVTFQEGISRTEIARILEERLYGFSTEEFMKKTEGREGYLFPDTYIFTPNTSVDTVLEAFERNFEDKIEPLRDEIASSSRSLSDIIHMAAILEGEARLYETRRIVAGILWRRMDIGMPLQVDASFVYGIGKSSEQLTLNDLATDHPYNTYTRTGFTPTPIGNPGLESIQAALRPIRTEYLFFLTDNDGVMRYAKTNAEHELNKERYLD